MIVLPGYGERIPEQKMQAERCRVKAIRWFGLPGGYYGHNDPFFPEWLLEEAARLLWLYCQMEIISRAGSEAGYRREPRKTWTARFIKFQRWHRTSPVSSEDKSACRSRCSRHSYLHQGLSSTQQHQWPCTVPSLRKRGSLPELDACALIPHKALMRAVQQSAWEMKYAIYSVCVSLVYVLLEFLIRSKTWQNYKVTHFSSGAFLNRAVYEHFNVWICICVPMRTADSS